MIYNVFLFCSVLECFDDAFAIVSKMRETPKSTDNAASVFAKQKKKKMLYLSSRKELPSFKIQN